MNLPLHGPVPHSYRYLGESDEEWREREPYVIAERAEELTEEVKQKIRDRVEGTISLLAQASSEMSFMDLDIGLVMNTGFQSLSKEQVVGEIEGLLRGDVDAVETVAREAIIINLLYELPDEPES